SARCQKGAQLVRNLPGGQLTSLVGVVQRFAEWKDGVRVLVLSQREQRVIAVRARRLDAADADREQRPIEGLRDARRRVDREERPALNQRDAVAAVRLV